MVHYKLIAEYQSVLGRAAQGGEIGFPEERLGRFLAALITIGDEVTVRCLLQPNLRDEDDHFIYETAFAASPCTIVSQNIRELRRTRTTMAWSSRPDARANPTGDRIPCLARGMGLSENRFYSGLIQEGLLMREQLAYFEKLRADAGRCVRRIDPAGCGTGCRARA